MKNIKKRFEKARNIMEEAHIDCLVISPSSDLYYLTGYNGIFMERPVFLLLTKVDAFFILPEFELSSLDHEIAECTTCIAWKDTENPYEKAAACFGESIETAAISNLTPSVMFYKLQEIFPRSRWVLGERVMAILRAKKDKKELALMREAHVLAGNAFLKLMEKGLKGRTELDAAKMLKNLIIDEGLTCQGLPLVATGAFGAMPHHHAENVLISKGDAVVIDFGGGYEGYFSDITRTVIVEREPEEFSEVYNVVRKANETVCRYAVQGRTCEALDQMARKIITKAGYGDYFTHRLGHGIGLDIHEEPYIVSGNQKLIELGNTFSNEPGIYLPDQFGVRIEDVLYIGEKGAVCLTELTHDMMTVD